jgi:xanthine dehydrogenase YagS FAD-binding subunit
MSIIELSRVAGGEFRAGGTDVMSRRGAGPYHDLSGLTELRGVTHGADGSVRVGALTTVAEVAGLASHPALAATAGALATPQIRAAGTLGGNLLQRNRCWYFRNPAFSCFQTGGDSCPARQGPDLYQAIVDGGPCVAPHPSSLAMALLTYDVTVEVHGRDPMPLADLYGPDPASDHLLGPGAILVAVVLPAPVYGERAAYHRAISRFEAEWPLVEAVARVTADSTGMRSVAVAAGGVARTPLRLSEVEAALAGGASPEEAAELVLARCDRPDHYKARLFAGTVLEVLERALV